MRALRTVAASAMITQLRGGAQGQMSHRVVENLRQESFRLKPVAWNAFQIRHRAAEEGQSAGALALDESFQRLANQSRFLRHAGELLSGAYEIVIQRKRRSHCGSLSRGSVKVR